MSTEATVIAPSRGWRVINLSELWAYRELLWVLAARDVRVRYKQTILGAGWAIVRPLTTTVVLSVVFGGLAKMPSDGYPYPVFVYAALLPWTFFASAVGSAGSSVVGSANLISKVYFPRLIVPLASIGSALVDLLVSAAVLLLLLVYYDQALSWRILLFPLLCLAVALTALGVGTFAAALSASYRDVGHLIPFVVQIWMYATPVVYPVSLIPEAWRPLIYLNPLTGLCEASRAVFLGQPLDGRSILLSVFVSIVAFAVGVAYFERVERRFADVI